MDTTQDQNEFSPQENLKQPGKMNIRINDDSIWRLAKKRAFFKQFVAIYIIVSITLSIVWYVTPGENAYFWPKWIMLSWGLGVIIQYMNAYHISNLFSQEKEYEKIKSKLKNDLV